MRRLLVFVVGLIAMAWPLAALAHPHVFVDTAIKVVFDASGRLAHVVYDWTFDDAYSAWAMEGLETDGKGNVTPKALQGLADLMVKNVADYAYYTFASEGDRQLDFSAAPNPKIRFDGQHLILSFAVTPAKPYAIGQALRLSVDDPTYYVAMNMGMNTVSFDGEPANCKASMKRGKPLPEELAAKLYAIPADVTRIPKELELALRVTQDAIIIACPGGSGTTKAAKAEGKTHLAETAPANALDAIGALSDQTLATDPPPETPPAPVPFEVPVAPVPGAAPQALSPTETVADAVAEAPGAVSAPPSEAPLAPQSLSGTVHLVTPFGNAPNEPGFAMPRTGFLGWIGQLQQDFYHGLVSAMSRLKTDWTAFWMLGGLSFLYGVFHAAGPGHGKLVISSYVLADQQQVRRGILLSFLSAMLQSVVAIAFVLTAAAVLRLTSVAMGNAVNWIGIISYAMITAMGLWLLARKLFGLAGHGHAESTPRREPYFAAAGGFGKLAPVVTAPYPQPARLALQARSAPGFRSSLRAEHATHSHLVTAHQTRGSWQTQLGVVLSVGLRPCSGALIVLVFAMSQHMLLAGALAVVLMGLGTAITTGLLATMAGSFSTLTQVVLGPQSRAAATLLGLAEVAGAIVVTVFGLSLLAYSLIG